MRLGLGIGLLLMGIGLGLGVALLVMAPSAQKHGHRSARPGASASAGSVLLPEVPAAPGELAEALDVPDLAHVEPSAIIAQGRRLALRLEPTAVLGCSSPVTTAPRLEGGLLDLRPEADKTFMGLTFIYRPTGRRPGEDAQGQISIRVRAGRVTARRETPPLPDCGPNGGPYPDPRCSVAKAWTVVVGAGVAANAVASVVLDRDGLNDAAPTFWRFSVDGHDEYRSKVDAQTCQLVAAPKTGAGGAAKPTGGKRRGLDDGFQ
jgi:hypothetical protein